MTDRPRRSPPIETCRFCSGRLLTSVFDTAFRDVAGEFSSLITTLFRDERQRRLAIARWELGQADDFDHVVVNDDVDEAVAAIGRILDATPA
jgi:hypothetical protein